MLISDVLKGKATQGIITVRPEASVRELVRVLAANHIGAAVVSPDGSQIAGIVSERDIVRALVAGAGVLDQSVADVMTSEVVTCKPGDQIEFLAAEMTERRIRHVPVVSDTLLVGIVSIGDVVKSRIAQLHSEKGHLEDYLLG